MFQGQKNDPTKGTLRPALHALLERILSEYQENCAIWPSSEYKDQHGDDDWGRLTGVDRSADVRRRGTDAFSSMFVASMS